MSDHRCRKIQEKAEDLAAVSPYGVHEVAHALEHAVNAICDHGRQHVTLNGELVCYWCGELLAALEAIPGDS